MKRRQVQFGFFAIGLFFLFLAFSPGRIIAFDVAIRLEVARALWTQASVFLEPSTPVADGVFQVAGNPGATSFYGIGQSLAFIPFDIFGAALEAVATASSWQRHLRALPIVFLYVPLCGVLWWFSIGLWLRQMGLSRNAALRSAFFFSLGTILLVYSSQTAQEESLVASLSLLSLTFWFKALFGKVGNSRKHALVAGLLAGSVLLVRLNALFSLLPLLGVTVDRILQTRRFPMRPTGYALSGFAVPAALILLFAQWRFHSPFATGYDLALAHGLGVFWGSFQPEVFWGLMVGPGKGLWVLSPLLLLAFVGWRKAWRKLPGLGISIGLAFVASFSLCAFILNNPDGSECWGARYQVHLIGLLAWPVWVGWKQLSHQRVALALWSLGFLFSLAGFAAPDALEYMQSDSAHKPRTRLITGLLDGHLGRRLSNIGLSIVGETESEPRLRQMRENYVPNLWGFSWQTKSSNGVLRTGILGAWIACLATAVIFLLRAFGFPLRLRYRPRILVRYDSPQ